ncbi:hypothetical protein CCMA1212_000863 [Trichoderma ghanense]|uniref:Uncharacterized protein n=1 Tax=Trichoderma ghanense TaxID=65468 RepID=A0ABY2HHE0_9HYPO
MALLKRKRSAAQLFPPSAPDSSMMALDAPALHSRTLKRYRDNRPSDEEVHRKFYEWRAHHHRLSPHSCPPAEHTLDLLYSAQQRQQQDQHHNHQHGVAAVAQGLAANQMLPVSSSDPSPLPTSSSTHAGQQSLHRFWNIGSQPSSGTSSPGLADPLGAPTPTACDDCGAPLAGADGAGDNGMDLDGGAAQDMACGACGKHVCFSCSVSNLGEEKRCLQCAGRRVWIGGIGWTIAGLSVC